MANWTVSSWSNPETQGDNVTAGSMAAYADLTITPNTGYIIQATQFKIGGATESPTNTWTGGNLDSEVYKVVFSDNGTAGTATNTVNARVHFSAAATGGSSWSMPGNNDTLYIDIDEKSSIIADEDRYFCVRSEFISRTDGNGNNKHTGTYASAPTGITTTNNSPAVFNVGDGPAEHLHSGIVSQNQTFPGAQIFQLTLATNTTFGYYYETIPTINIASGLWSSYYTVLDSNPVYTSMTVGGVTVSKLTSITFTAYYMPPINMTGLHPDPYSSASAMCELGQVIEFNDDIRQEDQGRPGAKPYIRTTTIDTSNINPNGETRIVTIDGDYNSKFYLQIVSSDSGKTYDFGPVGSGVGGVFTSGGTTMSASNTMGTNGHIQYPIEFPAISSNTTYDIIIIPISPTGTVSPPVPIAAAELRLYQYVNATVTLDLNDAGSTSLWDVGDFPAPITLAARAGYSYDAALRKAFSWTITEAMATGSITSIAPKSSLDWTLSDSGASIITKTDGNISGTSFDVDSTTNIATGASISVSTVKYPIFRQEVASEIIIADAETTKSLTQTPNADNIFAGMVVTSDDIRSDITVTVESVLEGGSVILSEEINTETSNPLTFSSSGVTVSSVTDSNTLVSSTNMTGIKDNIDLTFGGSGEETTDLIAYVSDVSSTQSGDNVILAGTLNIESMPESDRTIYLDATKLITITP